MGLRMGHALVSFFPALLISLSLSADRVRCRGAEAAQRPARSQSPHGARLLTLLASRPSRICAAAAAAS
eukprot:358822-Chlamydomonas_euryale.AAC.4